MSQSSDWLAQPGLSLGFRAVSLTTKLQETLASTATTGPPAQVCSSRGALARRRWSTQTPSQLNTAMCARQGDRGSASEGPQEHFSAGGVPPQPEKNIRARWQRLGPYPPTGLHVDKDPVPLGNEKDGWCALCGVRSGWMQCGRCAGKGEYLVLPGKAGVKDRVGTARCKMCYGRGAVPCFLCGLPDMERWDEWHAYAKRNPVKKKRPS